MEEKNLDINKKAAADGEMPSDLEDLGEEEVAQAVEGLKMGQGERGSSPSIVHDPKMEAEIKEMFRDIVSQYIAPVGKSIRALANGDASERNIDICIGALKPLILAAEEIHYNDIYDVLKSIEQPLTAFRDGKKRLLSKKDIRNITTDYKELMRLISRSVGSEMLELTATGAVRATTAAPLASQPAGSMEELEELHISDALAYFKDVDPDGIQRLYAAGLIKLGLLSQATAQEISESTGIDLDTAESLKQCAQTALNGMSLTIRPAVPSRPKSEEHYETPAARTARFEIEDEGEDEGSLTTPREDRQRWVSALDAIMSEISHCYQSTSNLTAELERSHRAALRMRVAREQLKGEMEFYQADLSDMLTSDETLNDELGTPHNAHRQVLKHLQQTIDAVNSLMKRTEAIYSQIDNAMEDLQEIESQLILLRRRKGLTKSGLRRRTPEPIEESDSNN